MGRSSVLPAMGKDMLTVRQQRSTHLQDSQLTLTATSTSLIPATPASEGSLQQALSRRLPAAASQDTPMVQLARRSLMAPLESRSMSTTTFTSPILTMIEFAKSVRRDK